MTEKACSEPPRLMTVPVKVLDYMLSMQVSRCQPKLYKSDVEVQTSCSDCSFYMHGYGTHVKHAIKGSKLILATSTLATLGCKQPIESSLPVGSR